MTRSDALGLVALAGRAELRAWEGDTGTGHGSGVSPVLVGMVCLVKYVLPVIIPINKTLLPMNSYIINQRNTY